MWFETETSRKCIGAACLWSMKAVGMKKQHVEGRWMCFAFFVLGRLSCSVLVPPALTRGESELLFPAPPYSPTLHLQCSFYQQQIFLLNPRVPFCMLPFYSWTLFSSFRAPSSEISKKMSTHFNLPVITLKIPACMSCLWNWSQQQAPYYSIPWASVGIGSSDLCIRSRSGCHLEMLLNCVSHVNHRLLCTEIFALKATEGNEEEIFPLIARGIWPLKGGLQRRCGAGSLDASLGGKIWMNLCDLREGYLSVHPRWRLSPLWTGHASHSSMAHFLTAITLSCRKSLW